MYCVRYKKSFRDKYREELVKGKLIDLPFGEDRYEIVEVKEVDETFKGKVFETYSDAKLELSMREIESHGQIHVSSSLQKRNQRQRSRPSRNPGHVSYDPGYESQKNALLRKPQGVSAFVPEAAFHLTLEPGSAKYKKLIKLIDNESERSSRASIRAIGLIRLIVGESEADIVMAMGVASSTIQGWVRTLKKIQWKLEKGQHIQSVKDEFDQTDREF